MANKKTVWAEQEPDEEDDVLQPLQNEFAQPQNQQRQWDLEEQYEQGEHQYYEEDGDQEEFKICLQQIDCLNPPIKINLENIPIAASEDQVTQFCMQKCQDKSAVVECVLYKDRGRPTGYGHIMLKTRQSAKDVLWQWGERLLSKNVQMYLDEEYDESIASEEQDQQQKASSQPQQQQKINQQTQEQAKKQQPEQQSSSNKNTQQQQEIPQQQNLVKKQESSKAVQQIKQEQSAWQTETQEWGSSQQGSWGQNPAQIESSWGNQTENIQGGWSKAPQSSWTENTKNVQTSSVQQIKTETTTSVQKQSVQQDSNQVQQNQLLTEPQAKKPLVATVPASAPAWSNKEVTTQILSQPKVNQVQAQQQIQNLAVKPQLSQAQMKLLQKKNEADLVRKQKAEELLQKEKEKQELKEKNQTFRRAKSLRGRRGNRGRQSQPQEDRYQTNFQPQEEAKTWGGEQWSQQEDQVSWRQQWNQKQEQLEENQNQQQAGEQNQQQAWGQQDLQNQPYQNEGRGIRGGRGQGRWQGRGQEGEVRGGRGQGRWQGRGQEGEVRGGRGQGRWQGRGQEGEIRGGRGQGRWQGRGQEGEVRGGRGQGRWQGRGQEGGQGTFTENTGSWNQQVHQPQWNQENSRGQRWNNERGSVGRGRRANQQNYGFSQNDSGQQQSNN